MRAGTKFLLFFSANACLFIHKYFTWGEIKKGFILNVSSQGSLEVLSCPQAAKNNVSHTFRPQGPKITGETKCGSCKNYSSGNSKEWWKM